MKRNRIISGFFAITMVLLILIESTQTSFGASSERPITSVSFPTNVTLQVGESKTLAVSVYPSNTTYLTNIEWGCQSNGHIDYKVNGFGSYWGKPSSEVITGTSVGIAYLNVTVKVFDSKKNYKTKYDLQTKVTVVARKPGTDNTGNNNSTNNTINSNNPYNTNIPEDAFRVQTVVRNSLFGVTLRKVSKGKKSFTAKWKKAGKKQRKQFNGYQIQYSTSPDFTTGVKLKKTTNKKVSKVVIRRLKSKTYYYVRLRMFKKVKGKVVYSDWSNVKRVRTK